MKKYALIVLAFVISLFSLTIVYAYSYTNYNRRYDFTIDESYVDLDLIIDNDNHTIRDLMNDILSINSNYGLTVQLTYKADHTLNYIYLSVVESATSIPTYIFGVNGSSNIKSIFESNLTTPISTRSYNIYPGSSDVFYDQNYNTFLNCYRDGNNCDFRTGGGLGGYYYRYNTTNVFNNNNNFIVEISNNAEYYILLYTSNFDFIYTTTSPYPSLCSSNSYECYFKNLYINDNLIEVGDIIPSYYDLFVPDPDIHQSFDNFSDRLGYIFVGNIPKANISQFKIKTQFNYIDDNYTSNLTYFRYFYGRVNHTTYYTYEPIDCTFTNAISEGADSNNYFDGYISPHGFTCSSDLTPYDEIFIKIRPALNSADINPTTYNLNLSVNYGNVYNFNSQSNIKLGDLMIFETFNDLPNTFGIVLSSPRVQGFEYHISDTEWVVSQYFDRTTHNFFNYGAYEHGFGTVSNKNLYLHTFPDVVNGLTNLKLFVSPDTIISYSNVNNFTYLDEDNELTTSSLNLNLIDQSGTNYDISYYFNLINGYIDSLDEDLINLHENIQAGWDRIPSPHNEIIITLFIITCMFLLITIIRK